MSLPGGFTLDLNRLHKDLRRFREATAGCQLTAEQVVALGALLDQIVRLLETLSREGCFVGNPAKDARIKGPNIPQN